MTQAAPPAARRESLIQRYVPGLTLVTSYQRGWLPRDLVAGLVLSALLIAQGRAYAEPAGLLAVTGLYT